MTGSDPKADLHRYLQEAREALVGKLDGEDGAEPNADMWATPAESREQILGLYHRAWAHSDETIEALPLDATGRVAWWRAGRNEVTLHRILVHMIAETHRHAGHADIVRELIDGAAGLRKDNDNMPPADQAWWQNYRTRLESAARQAAQPDRDWSHRRSWGAMPTGR